MAGSIRYINPEGLHKNPAFSQVVATQGPGKIIFIGGQNAVNAEGAIVGKGDIATQTGQVMLNLQIALTECNATFGNIVKLNIYVVVGHDAFSAFVASQKFLLTASNPPAITVLFVAGLINPDFLIEIDATAFVPE